MTCKLSVRFFQENELKLYRTYIEQVISHQIFVQDLTETRFFFFFIEIPLWVAFFVCLCIFYVIQWVAAESEMKVCVFSGFLLAFAVLLDLFLLKSWPLLGISLIQVDYL